MTSEIALLNKRAVALAADSAVTIKEGGKIYNTANKLFCLSEYSPVAIMVYGNSEFMRVPWETIIKLFRKKILRKTHPKLEDYANEFIEFIDKNEIGIDKKEQDEYLRFSIHTLLEEIKKKTLENIEKKLSSKALSEKEIKQIADEIIDKYLNDFLSKDRLKCIPSGFIRSFQIKFNEIFNENLDTVFQEFPLSDISKNKLKKIIIAAINRNNIPVWYSGIVIAGFGEKQIFPSLRSYKVEALINNRLKYIEENDHNIDISADMGAAIRSFAQTDVVYTFMQGIDFQYRNKKRLYLKKIFDDYPLVLIKNLQELSKISEKRKKKLEVALKSIGNNLFDEYVENMTNYSRKNFIDPVMNIIQVLPTDELASVAESLVNITSFRRKVSMSKETVGGPIDVAIITKGDGFIWIKRKHYFKAELNPQFFRKYKERYSNEKS